MFGTAVNIPCFYVIIYFLVIVTSFNIDTKYPIFFESSEKDFFGYSVGLLRNREGQHALITAPRANSSLLRDQLYQPGVLFKCKISFRSRLQSCTEVLLDSFGNTVTFRGSNRSFMDKKDNMFLGVSLDVQQSSGNSRVVTCGHLWKNQYYKNHFLVNGVCYVINNELDPKTVKKLVPLVNKSKQSIVPPGIYYYAFGQAGMSAVFSEDGEYLFLGAPGIYDWKGTVLTYVNPTNDRDYDEPSIPDPTAELSPESYIGYSIASGKFFNNSETYIAVGAPRGKNSHGQVFFVKAGNPEVKKFLVFLKKEGSQFGEYFGASVLGVNMNGDKFTDLLVGAPFYSLESGGDEGKVYVYISNGVGLQEYAELHGENIPNARFGSCISSIGDINQDGWNDIAIGAPYEDGKGAVYIYHGSSSGMNPQYVQRLQASKLSPSLQGFGISVSHGVDVDGNYYPDILIGSYESSQAVLLRTHPVIKLTGRLEFFPDQINTNVTSCSFEGKSVPCFNVTTCLHYTGKNSQLNLIFETELYIDYDKQINRSRSYFITDGNRSHVIKRKVSVDIGMDTCFIDTAMIRFAIKDLITPMNFLYIYRLVNNTTDEFCKSCPVIDQTMHSNNISKSIFFQTGCGIDSVCFSDLVINATIVDNPKNLPLIIGENTTLTINIDITNKGEPAYISELLIYLPPETPNVYKDSCTLLSDKHEANETLLCDLENPLRKDKKVNVQIKIDISKIPSNTKVLRIFLEANTVSTEVNPSDNDMELLIRFKRLADIAITGVFEHELVQYDDVKQTPISVKHTYFVMNHGPSPIDVIDIDLYIPTEYKNGKSLVEFVGFTKLEVDTGEPLTIPATCDDSAIELITEKPDIPNPRDGIFDEEDLVAQNRSNRTVRRVSEEKIVISDIELTTQTAKARKDYSGKKRRNYVINCDTANCTLIRCSASPFLESRKFAKLGIVMQVNMSVLDEVLDPWYEIEFYTSAKIFIKNDDGDIQPQYNSPDEASVRTVLLHPSPMLPEEIDLWIIYVSIAIGVLLLVIILIVLVKIGFFKRQQKEKMREMLTNKDHKEWDPYLINSDSETIEGEPPINT